MEILRGAFSLLISHIGDIVALVAVLGLIFNKVQERDTALSSTYFSKMTASYEHFWLAFTKFFYHQNDDNRDQLSVAVYNAVLYSSEDIAKGIQFLYNDCIEYSRTGSPDAKELDRLAGILEDLMHEDVLTFRKRGSR